MNRRDFLTLSGSLAASWGLPIHQHSPATNTSSIKAILFDAFPIFDPAPVANLATQLFPEKANDLITIWRTKLFEYTWLRSLMNAYTDFLTITSDALEYAAESQKMNISEDQHRQLVETYNHLQVWPEVPAALTQLKATGYRLGILSNFTPDMLRINTQKNNLANHFEHLLSVDKIKTYKPDPRTYHLGTETFQLSKEEILFVPSTGWDAAGAKNYGYPTFWIRRRQDPPDRLKAIPDGEGSNLQQLADWLTTHFPGPSR